MIKNKVMNETNNQKKVILRNGMLLPKSLEIKALGVLLVTEKFKEIVEVNNAQYRMLQPVVPISNM